MRAVADECRSRKSQRLSPALERSSRAEADPLIAYSSLPFRSMTFTRSVSSVARCELAAPSSTRRATGGAESHSCVRSRLRWVPARFRHAEPMKTSMLCAASSLVRRADCIAEESTVSSFPLAHSAMKIRV